jgi:hypothetical protein
LWGGGSLIYVGDLGKLVYWTARDQDAYYEITVPTNVKTAPGAAWSWVRKPIVSAGGTNGKVPSQLTKMNTTYHRMDYAPALKSLMWVVPQNSSGTWGNQVMCIRIAP